MKERAYKPGSVSAEAVAIIHLRHASPRACSDLPGSSREPRFTAKQRTSLFGLAPSGVYPATDVDRRGALLPHHFTLTSDLAGAGGIFSVALSVDLRPPGVTWHPALWSPDFPPNAHADAFSDRPTRSRASLASARA